MKERGERGRKREGEGGREEYKEGGERERIYSKKLPTHSNKLTNQLIEISTHLIKSKLQSD